MKFVMPAGISCVWSYFMVTSILIVPSHRLHDIFWCCDANMRRIIMQRRVVMVTCGELCCWFIWDVELFNINLLDWLICCMKNVLFMRCYCFAVRMKSMVVFNFPDINDIPCYAWWWFFLWWCMNFYFDSLSTILHAFRSWEKRSSYISYR